MGDDIKELLQSVDKDMQKSLEAMESDFHKFRTGRANTAMVEKLQVDYYGTYTPLQSLAAISIPEATQIMIRPFDPTSLKLIEKAIAESDLKVNPSNDGKAIRITLPPLTQDRRRDLQKQVGKRVEDAKISIRNIRREAMEMLKEFEDEKMIAEDEHKRGKEELEKVTKVFGDKAEEIGTRKEREVMEI